MNIAGLRAAFSLKQRFNVDVLWNVASLAVLGVSGIVINIVIAAYEGSDALGVFNQVFAIYIMLSQISVGGLHFSVLKHISHNQDDRRKCADISVSALLLGLIAALVVCIPAYALRGVAGRLLESPDVAIGVALVLPGLLFFSLNKILLNILNGVRAMRAFAVFQSLRFILILTAIAIILRMDMPSAYLAASLSAAEIVLFVLLLAYISFGVVALRPTSRIAAWFPEHISFGLRGFFSGLLSEMNTRVDVLMLGYFLDDKTVGVYSFAAILAEGFAQLPVVIRRNVDPIIGRCFAEHDFAKMRDATLKVKKITYLVMFAVSVAAVALYPVVLPLFVKDAEFSASWGIFAILMGGIFLNSGYRPFLGVLLQGGRPGMYTVLIAAVVGGNIVLNAVFIPLLHMSGAALATSAAYVLEAVLVVVFARRCFGLRL